MIVIVIVIVIVLSHLYGTGVPTRFLTKDNSLLGKCYECAPTEFFLDLLEDNVYDCDLQVIVQRALASKDMSHAKGACVLAGWLRVDFLYIASDDCITRQKTFQL